MKKLCVSLLFILSAGHSPAQQGDQAVSQENLSRLLKTLCADAMMGRPASKPALIEPATAFIESEFKKTGLKPLDGLAGFRQEFEKKKITPVTNEVTVDAVRIPPEHVLVVSDKAKLELSHGLTQRKITYDSTEQGHDQYFFRQALREIRDTTSAVIWVSPEFSRAFARLKKFYSERFSTNNHADKVFILGDAGSSCSIKAKQKIEVIRMSNVVGMLEGKSRPDEMVIFSAHYDHIGIQSPVDEDSIANGADDDASGTTAVIALAAHFSKKADNNRTIIFVAFTAEEIGGFGSKYFSEGLDPRRIVAMFNIEMIGKPSKWGTGHAFITGFERSDFGSILQRNARATGFQFMPDPYPEEDLFYRSDNANLARQGVPAHSISTDQIDIDELYHSVDDEFETVDVANLAATIRAIATASRTIIDGTDTPARIDKQTVRGGG